jgi:hypothetical protein
MNPRFLDASLACDGPTSSDDWDSRHSVSDAEATAHGLDSGDYHETCCPLCEVTTEVAS